MVEHQGQNAKAAEREGVSLLPTELLFGNQEEWTKIVEAIEQIILPQLESNWVTLLAAPKTSLSGSLGESIHAAYHHISVPSKYVVAKIGFLLRGQAAISVGEKIRIFKAPAGIFVAKGFPLNLHGEVNGQVPYSEWLICTITTFGAFVLQCRVTQNVHYEGKSHLILHPVLASLMEGSREWTAANKVILRAIFGLLVRANPALSTFWELLPPSFVEMPSILRQALRLLHHNYERPLRLKDIANWCHVNTAHLCRLFQQWIGVSPHAYLVKLRMSAAWKLLMETSLPPSFIASLVGYPKWSQFRFLFTKTFGVHPHQVREGVSLKPYNGWNLTNIVSN